MSQGLRLPLLVRSAASVLMFALLCAVISASDVRAQDKTILFVYNPDQNTGEADPNSGEIRDEDSELIRIITEDLGYEIELRGMTEVELSDTAFVDGIFISESVGSGDVVNRIILPEDAHLGNFGIPIIAAEVFIYDDNHWMKTGEGYGTDFAHGFADNDKVIVPPSDHPILGGLRQGPVAVYDDRPIGAGTNQIGYVVPHESADMILALPGSSTFGGSELQAHPERRATMFAYEEGDVIPTPDGDITMRARRVGFFAHTRGSENLSEVGSQLVANAIAWAMGDEDKIQQIEAEAPKVLFLYDANQNTGVVTDGQMKDEDLQLLTLLQDSLGFEPVAVDQNQVVLDDTLGVEAIYISESAGSGSIVNNFITPLEGGSRYGNVTVPIVAAEVFVWDDMQWINHISGEFPIDVAWGFAESDSILVTTLVHPITTGLEEGFAIPYTAPDDGEGINQTGYGVPKSSAEIAALVSPEARVGGDIIAPFDQDRATIFTYSVGDVLFESDTLNIITPARRASFFAHTRGSENLSVTGQQLFLNTIRWATGMDQFVTTVQQTSVAAERGNELPDGFAIESVYPNPFNPSTTLQLAVRQVGAYQLRVFDLLGRLVEQRDLSVEQTGQVPVNIEMGDRASGMYLIQVTHRASGATATARAMLLK